MGLFGYLPMMCLVSFVWVIHKDWPVFIPVGGRTSYLGDVIAMVAETLEAARAARELIRVEYDVLPLSQTLLRQS